MFPVLVQKLIDEHHYPLVDAQSVDDFLARQPYSLLFFCNDAKQFPETLDVAVILPELVKAFDGRIVPALVSRDDELTLHKLYGFRAWPSLVFFRDGKLLGSISKVRNWDDYLKEIQTLLACELDQSGTQIPSVTLSGKL